MKKGTIEKIIKELNNGKQPKIMFGKDIVDLDIPVSPNQYGNIISLSKLDDMSDESLNVYEVVINLEKFYDYNKALDDHSWKDNKTNTFTASAEEAGAYPKNHIVKFYIDDMTNEPEDFCNLVYIRENQEKEKLFDEFLNSNSTYTYVEWLENCILGI